MSIWFRTSVLFFLLTVPFVSNVALSADGAEDLLLEVTQSSMTYIQREDTVFLTSVGYLKNLSSQNISDITLEAQFFNADGDLIDTTNDKIYGVELSGNSTMAFKLQTYPAKEQEEYASHKVRVISFDRERVSECKASTSRPPVSAPKKRALWLDILISWFPMLLLIGVWIYFIKRMGGKGSQQNRTIDLIETQNGLFSKQNKSIDRIAKAIENNDKG